MIPEAMVSATERTNGHRIQGSIAGDGAFFLTQLLPATYRLSGTKGGFKQLSIAGLKVNVDTTVTQDLVLEIGATSQSVEVAAQTSLVETTSGALGTTVQLSRVAGRCPWWTGMYSAW